MTRDGGCLCGCVRYSAELVDTTFGACHCGMCRRFAGGPFLAVRTAAVTWQQDEALRTFDSSTWAERGFCGTCGSSLFYRLKGDGQTMVALGSLDDPSGLTLTHELFTDKRPAGYCFAGELHGMTEAQVFARYGG